MSLLRQVDINKNNLGFDAWGRNKVVQDKSILHGMFTYNVPINTWKEIINGVEQTSFVNATSVNGALELQGNGTQEIVLSTYRNPRYEPNRGHLYSTSMILPIPTATGIRRFGFFTSQSGAFFELNSGVLYAVIRTTIGGVTTDDKHIITVPSSVDLAKGNIFDIQMQWRGVGNYKFFINLEEVLMVNYLGTLTNLSSFNPAYPLSFYCSGSVKLICGCVDISSEGGSDNGSTYGSVSIDNLDGQVAISGYNVPIIAIRSKPTIGTLINTRDTLALLASAYSDNKAIFRVWVTRDTTAITPNDQAWLDYGDAHLEYIEYDNPNVATPMTFDTTKASLMFGCRVGQDITYSTSALFEGRTDIWLTPGDMLVFTMHRESGTGCTVGVTFEFAEQI